MAGAFVSHVSATSAIVARELFTSSGSVFVQISDENVHTSERYWTMFFNRGTSVVR